MSDEELIVGIANYLGVTANEKRAQINALLPVCLSELYAKASRLWFRDDDTFDIAVNDQIIKLTDVLPGYMKLRNLWTSSGRIVLWNPEKFRIQYPDESGYVGCPNKYIWLSRDTIYLHPKSDGPYTIHASYEYRPALKTMNDCPEEFHHVPFQYIMAIFEGSDKFVWKNLYKASLLDMIDSQPSIEDETEIIPEDIAAGIIASQTGGRY